MAKIQSFLLCFVVAAIIVLPTSHGQLTPNFYDSVCPEALPIVRRIVEQAIEQEARMGASLLRLHFHDCFVNGCDGSDLLDDTDNFTGEKTARPNLNSLRGFNVIDDIKAAVDEACNGYVVSCADILAIAARDSVDIWTATSDLLAVKGISPYSDGLQSPLTASKLDGWWFSPLGGPCYEVLLGRRDSLTASLNDANNDIPAPFLNFSGLLSNFQNHSLNLKDLVVLSGGHTIGLARCTTFSARIYNDTDINKDYAAELQQNCPANSTGPAGNNTAPLDPTSTMFDTVYYQALVQQKGLLHSDQELFNGASSDSDNLVQFYSNNRVNFFQDFGDSMIKMGNLKPLTGSDGQIRENCRKVNPT